MADHLDLTQHPAVNPFRPQARGSLELNPDEKRMLKILARHNGVGVDEAFALYKAVLAIQPSKRVIVAGKVAELASQIATDR